MDFQTSNTFGDNNSSVGRRKNNVWRAGEVHRQCRRHHSPHHVAVLIGHRELEGAGITAGDRHISRRDGQSVRIASREGYGYCICNHAVGFTALPPHTRGINPHHSRLRP